MYFNSAWGTHPLLFEEPTVGLEGIYKYMTPNTALT